MTGYIDSEAKHSIVKNKMSDIDEATKRTYVDEIRYMYKHIDRKISDIWDEIGLECPHCTNNINLEEEENTALEIEWLYMDYCREDLRENSSDYLERVFSDADVVFDLFSKYNDDDGGEIIGLKIMTDDLLAIQIHHAAFVASKKDLTNHQRELILSLMYSCVLEARKIIEATFPTLKTIFKI